MAEGYEIIPKADNLFDSNHGVMQSVINNGLCIDKVYGTDGNFINIDKINKSIGYIYHILEQNDFSGTSPLSTIGGGNSYILIGFSHIEPSSQLPAYGVQIAFGFGGTKIAIRNKSYQPGGGQWGAWTQV